MDRFFIPALIVTIEAKAKATAIVIATKEVVHNSGVVSVNVSVLVIVSSLVTLPVVAPAIVVCVYSEKIFSGTLIERDLVVDNPLL